jgi:hypothetical protein
MKNFRLLNITILSILLILFLSLLVLKNNLMVVKKNDTVNYSETFITTLNSSKFKNSNNWLENYSLRSHLKKIKLYKMNKSYYFKNYEKYAKDWLLNKNSLDYAKSDEILSKLFEAYTQKKPDHNFFFDFNDKNSYYILAHKNFMRDNFPLISNYLFFDWFNNSAIYSDCTKLEVFDTTFVLTNCIVNDKILYKKITFKPTLKKVTLGKIFFNINFFINVSLFIILIISLTAIIKIFKSAISINEI